MNIGKDLHLFQNPTIFRWFLESFLLPWDHSSPFGRNIPERNLHHCGRGFEHFLWHPQGVTIYHFQYFLEMVYPNASNSTLFVYTLAIYNPTMGPEQKHNENSLHNRHVRILAKSRIKKTWSLWNRRLSDERRLKPIRTKATGFIGVSFGSVGSDHQVWIRGTCNSKVRSWNCWGWHLCWPPWICFGAWGWYFLCGFSSHPMGCKW